jgi:hypothetical protein
MTTITQVAQAMQKVLTSKADEIGRKSGLIERERQISGSTFAQMLVLGWLSNPNSTLEELTQVGATLGVKIRAQGLDQRFGPESAEFARQLLAETVKVVVAINGVTIPLFERFTGVKVHDSTVVGLPTCLEQLWPGCGGSTGTSAALKMQVQLDLKTGKLDGPFPKPGKETDISGVIAREVELPAGCLWFGDLGYWNLELVKQYQDKAVFWFSRYKADTAVFAQGIRCQSLSEWLDSYGRDTIDVDVELGVQHRLNCRLIAIRVSAEIAAQRRENLLAQARKKGVLVSQTRLSLASWTIYVTTIPRTLLSVEEALVLGAVRWQIELLFKLWKSHTAIDESRSNNPWRVLTEVFLKLVATVIQHWVMVMSCWDIPNRSLFKAAKTIRAHALLLATTFTSLFKLRSALTLIQQCLRWGCRINKSKKTPHTFQRLLSLPAQPLDFANGEELDLLRA